ncbi:hypothetical protein CEXT_533291 [Caerostris extrusa]|uniref:Uncharacterized protein n=1 Tax=Caerostris extrusa TaxID=172846 RepID=A0AAV4PME9_CAEEX|nr:hypothetical protein CEXT_533291 [Caerostris extrusa]
MCVTKPCLQPVASHPLAAGVILLLARYHAIWCGTRTSGVNQDLEKLKYVSYSIALWWSDSQMAEIAERVSLEVSEANLHRMKSEFFVEQEVSESVRHPLWYGREFFSNVEQSG